MNWRVLGLGTAVLWMVTVGVIVALFVQGHTRPGADGRTEIRPGAGGAGSDPGGDAAIAQVGAWGGDGIGKPGPKPQGRRSRSPLSGYGNGGRRQSRRHVETTPGV
jgi:hypothetical protein